jgi:hypothetical protein
LLETPSDYLLNQEEVDRARDLLSSISLRGVRLVWEVRAPLTAAVINLMQDLNIVDCADLSKRKPSFDSDVVYGRLFGKGKHNLYQFTDEELVEIDRNAQSSQRVIALSYHGARMNMDAARFMHYKKTGNFIPVTSFTGVDSARAVLSEDAVFPCSKAELVESQGWKVVDLTANKRVHLSELLSAIPEKTYNDIDEVARELRVG